MAEPLTLYKLIILYMLKKVDFPLTNAQISEFVLDQEYTTYFTLQQAISELVEAGLIRMETIRNTSQYYLTEDGDMTLGYFTQKISAPIREDIDRYIQENKMALRNEVAIVADYYKNTAGEYSVHCEVEGEKRRPPGSHHQRSRQRSGHRHVQPLGQTLPGNLRIRHGDTTYRTEIRIKKCQA